MRRQVYIESRRGTISALAMGGVPQLGPGYQGGFALSGILRGIGTIAGGLLGLPRAAGPNAPGALAPKSFGGVLNPKNKGSTFDDFTLGIGAPRPLPTFDDVLSGASTTAPRRFGGRHRRTNPLNLKALGRADRRLEAFAKIARRYVSPNAPQRVVRTKRRKR